MSECKDLAATESVQAVIALITEKITLTTALRQCNISSAVFFRVIHNDPHLERQYSLAQFARTELMVDEILDIADTDIDPMRARNRIDARKWIASKMHPKKFGDRLDVNVNQTIDISNVLKEAMSRRALADSYQEDTIDADSRTISDTHVITETDRTSDAETSPQETEEDIFS